MRLLARPTFILTGALVLALLPFGAASAQKFLGYGRSICEGDVRLVETGLEIRPFESRASDIKNRVIAWTCNGRAQKEITCPEGTKKVLIDRTQGGLVVSFICLRR